MLGGILAEGGSVGGFFVRAQKSKKKKNNRPALLILEPLSKLKPNREKVGKNYFKIYKKVNYVFLKILIHLVRPNS